MNELKEKGVDNEHIIYVNFVVFRGILYGRDCTF